MSTYVVAMSQECPPVPRAKLVVRLKTNDERHANNYLPFALSDAERPGSSWFGFHVLLFKDGEIVFHRDTLKSMKEAAATLAELKREVAVAQVRGKKLSGART